jgi:ribosomal protein S18 acetylase RimI-like enzyme
MTGASIRRIGRNLSSGPFRLACIYWAVRKLTTVQVHHVYAIDLVPVTEAFSLAPPFQAHVLASLDELRALPEGIETQLNEQTGLSCRTLLQRGTRIYFFTDGHRVACQMNARQGEVLVDSPCDLVFRLEPDDVFLTYLYTREQYRGRGLARALIRYVCEDLAAKGIRRCFAHIRATNYASATAFRNAGWSPRGRIISTTSKRFIAAPGCRKSRVQVRATTSAGATPGSSP